MEEMPKVILRPSGIRSPHSVIERTGCFIFITSTIYMFIELYLLLLIRFYFYHSQNMSDSVMSASMIMTLLSILIGLNPPLNIINLSNFEKELEIVEENGIKQIADLGICIIGDDGNTSDLHGDSRGGDGSNNVSIHDNTNDNDLSLPPDLCTGQLTEKDVYAPQTDMGPSPSKTYAESQLTTEDLHDLDFVQM